MGFFGSLPKVNRFSFCTRNLKCAAFVVAFIGMLSSIHIAGMLSSPYCRDLYDVSSPVKLPVNIFRWLLFALEIVLLASVFAFLLSLFWTYPTTADVVIGGALATSFISIIYSILMLIQEQYTHCRWYNSQIFPLFLYIIMWGYFIIIINSYRDEM